MVDGRLSRGPVTSRMSRLFRAWQGTRQFAVSRIPGHCQSWSKRGLWEGKDEVLGESSATLTQSRYVRVIRYPGIVTVSGKSPHVGLQGMKRNFSVRLLLGLERRAYRRIYA